MKTDHLLFGAAYYSEYLPYDRVEKDMEMMEKAGMNTIRIAESTWSTIEPKDGIFDFTHLDKMLEAAARHHISVIVGTPTYAIPAWLAKKYPDILALTNNGQNIYGARQNMDITHVCDIHILSCTINVLTVIGQSQNIRVFFCQPCRDGVGRCPDNDRNMVACSRLKHFIEMCEIKDTVFWLDGAPGRFCDTDRVHACFFHHFHVFFHAVIWKVFRVISCPEK